MLRTPPVVVFALSLLAGGCAQTGSSGPARTSDGRVSVSPARPMLVSGTPIAWDAAIQHLGELAGGVVVEELALGVALDAACARAGVEITPDDLARERSLLLDSLGARANATRLLDRLRAERGLGPARFDAFLRRNAQLRALVQDRVRVSEADVTHALRIQRAQRVRARVLVVDTEREASQIRAELLTLSDPNVRTLMFASRAMEDSVAVSAPAGGSLGPVSSLDPGLPPALRDALATLEPGQLSRVLSIQGGYAIAMIDVLPGVASVVAPVQQRASDELAAELRTRAERVEMDRLAAELLGRVEISVLDPSMGWAFESRTTR